MIELPSRLNDIDPTLDAPFAEDKLDRATVASILKSIVESYSNSSCVLAINGEWGTGKTTFVKMWQKYMERMHYRTIYFNAWETDYISDPLVALLGELGEVIGETEKFDTVCASISRIALTTGTTVLNSIIKQTIGLSTEAVQTAINETRDIIKDNIKEYSKQKTSISEFKKRLSEYVANVNEEECTPLIFIIDELDRCNPHYAVKVLERIKHLFNIPNIFFVLPICKSQLECAIQGFYGSDKIDAANYLRRFFNLEYELPFPDCSKFYNYLYEYYEFEQFFEETKTHRSKQDNITLFKDAIKRLFNRTKIDFRTMDKLFIHCRIVAQTVHGDYASEMDVIFLLCYLKLLHFDIYNNIRSHTYTLQGLLSAIENIFPETLMNPQVSDNLDPHGFTYSIASLLLAYNQNRSIEYEKDILPVSRESELKLECKMLSTDNLKEALVNSRAESYSRWTSVNDITDKIDLLQHLR